MLRNLFAYKSTLDALEANKYIPEFDFDSELSMGKLSMVWQYLDDVVIQKFFEVSLKNRPFIITKGLLNKRYTSDGPKDIVGDIQIDFSDDYDRATFIDWLNKWFHSLPIDEGSPIRSLKRWLFGSIRKDIFGNFIPGIGSWLDGDRLPLYSRDEQIGFNEKTRLQQLYLTALYNFENNRRYLDAHTALASCRDCYAVPGYTLEDVLFIYCLIVERLQPLSKNISYIFGGFLSDAYLETCLRKTSLPYLFFLFESKLDYIIDYDKDMDKRDLFYRFADKKRGRAFTYTPDFERNTVQISLFQKETVQTIYKGNTLFLPYHIHSTAPSEYIKE